MVAAHIVPWNLHNLLDSCSVDIPFLRILFRFDLINVLGVRQVARDNRKFRSSNEACLAESISPSSYWRLT